MKYLKFSLIASFLFLFTIQTSVAQEVTKSTEKTYTCKKSKEAKVASATKVNDYEKAKTEKKSCVKSKEAKVASAAAENELENSAKKTYKDSKAEYHKAKTNKVASSSKSKVKEKKSCASKKQQDN